MNLPATLSPFSPELLSEEDLINHQILTSSYTGGEMVDVRRFLSRTPSQDGEKQDKILWIWGLFCYPKVRIDEQTGEEKHNVGVVFLIGDKDGPWDQYLSFESVSAVRFVERSLLPLINRGIIGVGDWSRGFPLQIWYVPLPVGHTYRFKLVSIK